MATKLGRMVTPYGVLSHIKSHDSEGGLELHEYDLKIKRMSFFKIKLVPLPSLLKKAEQRKLWRTERIKNIYRKRTSEG